MTLTNLQIELEIKKFTFKYLATKDATKILHYTRFVVELNNYAKQNLIAKGDPSEINCIYIISVISEALARYVELNAMKHPTYKVEKIKSFNYIVNLFENLLKDNNTKVNAFFIEFFKIY